MNTTTQVLSGKFKGAEVEILGTDVQVLGKHLFKVHNDVAHEYMQRFAQDIPSLLGTIYIAKIGKKEIALHESEVNLGKKKA